MNSLVGKTVAHFEILEALGAGGMGAVYGARDTKLGRSVALKMLPEAFAKSDERVERFKREARMVAALNHPNIASIYGFEDQSYSTPFLVLERVDGESLASRLKRGPLPIPEALRICKFMALALESAHDRGIVHRDLKPANVMINSAGVVKVLDFGLAQWTPKASGGDLADDPTIDASLTQLGHAVGTPGYMSPEQIRAAGQDERTDIFALGCVLYESIAGVRAFRGSTGAEVMASVLHREPDWLALPGQAPPELRGLLQRCLEKNPNDRLPAVGDARRAIEAMLEARSAASGAETVATSSAGGAPHNLPLQLTTFVGRRRELSECSQLLRQSRLVTLTGVGGSGKSRLMLRAAEGQIGEYADGVWYVDLAPFSDPERAPATLAVALGLRQAPREPLIETLTAHLRDRKALVLFDNCEHLIASMAVLIGALLRGCRNLRVLATSREPLRVEGEQSYPVAPLSLPDPSPTIDADTAGRSEAVRLFMERAGLVRADFALNEQTSPVVADICRRLDGIPLALELAAARMKVLSVGDIRTRLDDRFRLLTGGSRHALARHQTLRATIQWSYDHLSPDEQGLLRGLSVFAGGWTLEAAVAVAGSGQDEFAMMDLLAALTEKSLINVEWTQTNDSRYRFLETVRQYALEMLEGAGEAESRRNNHMLSMLALVERAEPELVGPDQGAWFHRLATEHENILAALTWCEKAEGGAAIGLRMGGALWRFWWYDGHFSIGWASLQRVLTRDREAAPTPARTQALYAAAQMAYRLGDLPMARDLFSQSLVLAQTIGDPVLIARAYNGLGNTAEGEENFDAARDYHEKSLALSRQIGSKRGIAVDLHNLGLIFLIQKKYPDAGPLFEEALVIFREIGDINGAQATVTNLALVATRTQSFPAACNYFEESFRLAEELPSQTVTADSLECFAELAVQMNIMDLSARILGTAAAVRKATGYVLSAEYRVIVEDMAARIRGELGERLHSQLDEEGRAMTFDEAVRSVRDWLAVHASGD